MSSPSHLLDGKQEQIIYGKLWQGKYHLYTKDRQLLKFIQKAIKKNPDKQEFCEFFVNYKERRKKRKTHDSETYSL